MSNPFLFDDVDDGDELATDPASNPFLQETAAVETEYPAENPFFAQVNNPFADYGNEAASEDLRKNSIPTSAAATAPTSEENIIFGTQATIVPVDNSAINIFSTDTNQYNTNVDELSDNNDKKKAPPPPRPTPPNQVTQELISSLADQLDHTSSNLLDRIPVTRTPSPVSIRDLHSPSPTPECGDLLDNFDDLNTLNNSAVDEQSNNFTGENPFATVHDVHSTSEIHKPLPPRPTPPRPTPPRRPSPPQIQQNVSAAPVEPQANMQTEQQPAQASNDIDLFDMFGTGQQPKPQQPKSNQDILSLFSAPKVESIQAQPDLLTSDIFPVSHQQQSTTVAPTAAPAAAPVTSAPKLPDAKPARPPLPPAPVVAHIAKEIKPPIVVNNPATVAAPAPETTTITSTIAPDPHQDIHEHEQPHIAEKSEAISTIQISQEPVSVADNLVINEPESHSDNSSAIESCIRTPEIPTPYYGGAGESSGSGYNEARGQTPISFEETANAYTNGASSYVSPTLASNPFAADDDIPRQTKNSILSQNQDEFDAFAAKFDSVKRDENAILDGFGASGYKSPLPANGKENEFLIFTISHQLFITYLFFFQHGEQKTLLIRLVTRVALMLRKVLIHS